MKTRRLVAGLAIAALLLLSATAAWAGAGEGVGCCTVINPGGGASAIKGTLALHYTMPTGIEPARSDVELRLERSSLRGFFTISLTNNLAGKNNEEIVCFILNPAEPGQNVADANAVEALVDEILEYFFEGKGLDSTNTKLVITRSSITNTDGPSGTDILDGGSSPTGRVLALADIVIYAVDAARLRLEDPFCE